MIKGVKSKVNAKTYSAWVEVGHRKADLLVGLEPSRGCKHLRIHEERTVVCSINGPLMSAMVSKMVLTLIPGGLKGYSDGKRSIPWYSPPAKGESGGPRFERGRRCLDQACDGRDSGMMHTIMKFPEGRGCTVNTITINHNESK